MSTIAVDGVTIHYETAGRGPTTLCLVHGSGGSSAVWSHQLEGLADVARVVALDLPGHGRSSGEGASRIDDAVAVVRAFVQRLGLGPVVLGGHSMGGAVAQGLALAHPDLLAGLVLVGTGARLRVLPAIGELLERDYPEGVRFVADHAVAASAPAELKESLYRVTLATPQKVLAGDFRACDAFDVMERIGSVALPTLVICGSEDQLTPPKYAQFLASRIAGARLALVPGSGHYVQVERPRETNQAIRDFLLTLVPKGTP
jgi:pimeloyl-ACP methyl ester carboxylesterase